MKLPCRKSLQYHLLPVSHEMWWDETTQQKMTAMLLTSCLSWDEMRLPSDNHCNVTHSLLANVMKNCLVENYWIVTHSLLVMRWGCWDCLVENHSSVTYLLKYNEITEVNQCNFTHTLVRTKCDEMTLQKVTSVTHKLLVMQLKSHESAMHKITAVSLTSWWTI